MTTRQYPKRRETDVTKTERDAKAAEDLTERKEVGRKMSDMEYEVWKLRHRTGPSGQRSA